MTANLNSIDVQPGVGRSKPSCKTHFETPFLIELTVNLACVLHALLLFSSSSSVGHMRSIRPLHPTLTCALPTPTPPHTHRPPPSRNVVLARPLAINTLRCDAPSSAHGPNRLSLDPLLSPAGPSSAVPLLDCLSAALISAPSAVLR